MRVRIRMYRQGLGDCFLLTFGEDAAAKHVLIDCGSLGATTTGVKMKDVVEDIGKTTGNHLDLLIATHEHKDHVSGFLTEKKRFDAMVVEHVWLAWTENPEDEIAQKLQKYQGDLITAAKLAARALENNGAAEDAERKATAEIGTGIRNLLGFFDENALGADLAKTVQQAMENAASMVKAGPQYLRPDADPLEPEWLPGVRFYVLGPPRDLEALAVLGDHGWPELYSLAAARATDLSASLEFFTSSQMLDRYYAKLDVEDRSVLTRLLPFDQRNRVEAADEAVWARCAASYDRPEDAWRRIDHDWLSGSSDLALQLDGQTNNTSLALAIELTESGRVLLFPGDAQVGNWLSWHEQKTSQGGVEPRSWRVKNGHESEKIVTAGDLLRRTVFYKVGHHASHNATLREKGLELMTSNDLIAMIPVDRKVAMKKKPQWHMPARALYRRLIEKAGGRVLRSDTGWATRENPDFKTLFSTQEWANWKSAQDAASVDVQELFVDCLI